MDGNTRGQRIAVVLFAIVVVVVSVLVTLFFSDSSVNPWREGEIIGYRNTTFTDAVLSCESETKSIYGERIKHLVVDNHSSHYDDKHLLYKIYFTLDLKKDDDINTETSLNYVNCYIKGQNGRLAKYDVFEHLEEVVKPITQSAPSLFDRSN